MKSGGALSSLSSTLQWVAHRYGLQTKLLEYRLRRDWPRIVGEQVARHTRPDAIRFHKLGLIADHSVWVQQLQYLKPSLIEKINEAAGETIVRDLILRVGEVPVEAAAPAKRAGTMSVCEETPDLLEADPRLQAIANPELRAQWTSVMARALHRQPAAASK